MLIHQQTSSNPACSVYVHAYNSAIIACMSLLLAMYMCIHPCKLLAGRSWGPGVVHALVQLYILLACSQLLEPFAEGHNALRMAAALLVCLHGIPMSMLTSCPCSSCFFCFFVPVSLKPRDPGIHRLLQCIGLHARLKSQILPIVPMVSVAAHKVAALDLD